MKKLLLLLALLANPAASTECYNYLKLAIGYKFQETDIGAHKDPISGWGEIGKQCKYLSIGIAHHSQPFTGWPIDKKFEYSKTEIFVAVTFKF